MKRNSKVLEGFSRFSKDYMSIIGLIILFIVFTISSPYFFTGTNIINILLQTVTVAIVAIGQGMLIIMFQVDLSIGYNVCLTCCVFAKLIKDFNWNPALGILVALIIGTAVGMVNGFLVSYVGIPAFIATLGLQYVCRGAAKLITNATPIGNLPESIGWLGNGYVGPIPIPVIFLIVLFVFFSFIMEETKFGRDVYAVGGGKVAAYYAGIPTKKVMFLGFAITGLLCGVSGVILTSRLNSAAITNGNLYEFDAYIGASIGGISLLGGKGKLAGALFGSLFLVTFFNGMTMLNVNPFWQDVLKGIVLILAMVLDVVRNRRRA